VNQEIELQSYLNDLIDQDTEAKLKAVVFLFLLFYDYFNIHFKLAKQQDTDGLAEEKREELREKSMNYKKELNGLFNEACFL
jgi:hypothetical protein